MTKDRVLTLMRRAMAGEAIELADGSTVTREALLELLELAPAPAGPPIRAVEGTWRPSPQLVDQVRAVYDRRTGPRIQPDC